jgi:hypothetical protein
VSAAAQWLAGFYPHVRLSITDDQLELYSDVDDTQALATIWAAALANEQLTVRARAGRRAAFEALAQ